MKTFSHLCLRSARACAPVPRALTVLCGPSFGQITRAVANPRLMQSALRYNL